MNERKVLSEQTSVEEVRQFLTHDAFVLVANALVSSRLDY